MGFDEPRWLHPSSILFGVLSTLKQFAFAVVFALFLAGRGNYFAMSLAGIAVVMTTMSAIFKYLTLRYALINGELRIDEGLIFRRHRVIPANRIQNIDLLQNPIHHLLKVAEVRIETAGGSEPEAKLRVLSLADVEDLRTAVFERRNDLSVGVGVGVVRSETTSDASSEDHVFLAKVESGKRLHQIPVGRLILAGLVSNRGFLLIPIAIGFFFQFDLEERFDYTRLKNAIPFDLVNEMGIGLAIAGAVIVLLLLRLFSVGWFLLRFFGYRLELRGEDLRVSCGMFTRISATVPRRRIQFISIHQTLLGRFFDLATIRIETAGGAGAKAEDAATSVGRRWFVPVITRAEALQILEELRPGLRIDETSLDWQATHPKTARRLSRIAILQSIAVAGMGYFAYPPWGAMAGLAALVMLLYLAKRYARSMKFARLNEWILYRSGIFTRKFSVTFFDKVQAVSILQSPFDRRWGMATLVVDTAAAGPAQHRIEVKYLPTPVADDELVQISDGAARYRLTGLR